MMGNSSLFFLFFFSDIPNSTQIRATYKYTYYAVSREYTYNAFLLKLRITAPNTLKNANAICKCFLGRKVIDPHVWSFIRRLRNNQDGGVVDLAQIQTQ